MELVGKVERELGKRGASRVLSELLILLIAVLLVLVFFAWIKGWLHSLMREVDALLERILALVRLNLPSG